MKARCLGGPWDGKILASSDIYLTILEGPGSVAWDGDSPLAPVFIAKRHGYLFQEFVLGDGSRYPCWTYQGVGSAPRQITTEKKEYTAVAVGGPADGMTLTSKYKRLAVPHVVKGRTSFRHSHYEWREKNCGTLFGYPVTEVCWQYAKHPEGMVPSGKRSWSWFVRRREMRQRQTVTFVVVKLAEYKDDKMVADEKEVMRGRLSRADDYDGELAIAEVGPVAIVVGPTPTREDVLRIEKVHEATKGIASSKLEVSILATKFPVS